MSESPLAGSRALAGGEAAAMKKTAAPDDLSREDKNWLLDRCRSRPELRRYGTVRRVQHLVDRCLAHHGAKGTQFADWKRACWNWILRQQEIDSRPRPAYRPQERDPHDHRWQQPVLLAEVIKGLSREH
jgi:hypothetical protein